MEKKESEDSFLRREDPIETEEVIPTTIQEEPTDWVSASYNGGVTFADDEDSIN